MSRRRYFEEQRSGNGAIYHCVETEIEPGDRIRLFNLMNKIKSDTISQDKINSVLNQLREGTAFNIHTQSPVSFSFSSTSTGYEPMAIWIRFDHYPAPSEQQGIIYKFQINDQRYVFMFSNRYDGMRDLINNADEDVDCVTSATESSIYRNHDKAYHHIVFEREAFDFEKYWNRQDVLREESEGFSFLGYYRKEYHYE